MMPSSYFISVLLLLLPIGASGQNTTFKLCHLELRTPVQLAPNTSCTTGSGLTVSSEGTAIVWQMDTETGTLKTSEDALCVHQRHDAQCQLELAECDGENDWRLICPRVNACPTSKGLRHYLVSADRQHIAVWGDHTQIWTGEGHDGLEYARSLQTHPETSILVSKVYTEFCDDFGTRWRECKN